MFLSFGIKKKDLENDADYAFTIFKNVIVGLGNENALKRSVLSSIEHNFPPPEEREKIRRQEEAAEAKMYNNKNKRIRRETTKTGGGKSGQGRQQKHGTKGVPPPPPPPPPPPMVPGAVPQAVPQISDNNSKPSPDTPKPDLQSEIERIKGGLTKKPQKVEKTNDKMIQGDGKNFLQNALSAAIKNRNAHLHMHDDENDEDDEDDWD